MSRLKKYACAHIPEMSPTQAEAVINVLDSIIETIWEAYGKQLNHTLTEPPPPRPEPDDLDAIF